MNKPITFSDMMLEAIQQNNQLAIFNVIKEKAKEHKHLMHIAAKIEKAVSDMNITEISSNIYIFTLLTNTKDMLKISPHITEAIVSALVVHPTFAEANLDAKTFDPLDFGLVLLPADESVKKSINKAGKNIPIMSNMLTELTSFINTNDMIHSLMTITLPLQDNAKYIISQVVF